MSHPEVPLEQTQEELVHHAHETTERWILGVALTAALLAACAAITALLAEHHANEGMIDQIRSSDLWNFYQAKSIKSNLLTTRIEILTALGKPADPKDLAKQDEYQTDLEKIKDEAEGKQKESETHLRHHKIFSYGVTMFQVAIAVGAIAVLTKRRRFWYVSLGFGAVGVVFLAAGLIVR